MSESVMITIIICATFIIIYAMSKKCDKGAK